MINVVITGLLLGIGLAMDAFAVSVSDGLKDGKMSIKKGVFIASIFAIFQAIMPLCGYLLGHAFIKYIEKVIPYIALVLLGFLGIKMIVEFIKDRKENKVCEISQQPVLYKVIFIQAIATSIDALSTGITFADYTFIEALVCVGIIGVVTLIICAFGVYIGKKSKTVLACYADLVGGIILLTIGIEIFITGLL